MYKEPNKRDWIIFIGLVILLLIGFVLEIYLRLN